MVGIYTALGSDRARGNVVAASYKSLTLGAHAQEGYGSCLVCLCTCVCVSVCYHSIGKIRRFYAEKEVRTGLS